MGKSGDGSVDFFRNNREESSSVFNKLYICVGGWERQPLSFAYCAKESRESATETILVWCVAERQLFF